MGPAGEDNKGGRTLNVHFILRQILVPVIRPQAFVTFQRQGEK